MKKKVEAAARTKRALNRRAGLPNRHRPLAYVDIIYDHPAELEKRRKRARADFVLKLCVYSYTRNFVRIICAMYWTAANYADVLFSTTVS